MNESDSVFLHVLVYPAGSNAEDINLDNNWQTLDLTNILARDNNLGEQIKTMLAPRSCSYSFYADADLRVASFKIPNLLQGEVEVYADIFIQSYSIEIARSSYRYERIMIYGYHIDKIA